MLDTIVGEPTWREWNTEERVKNLTTVLTELRKIENGQHAWCNSRDEGRLPSVKTELEKYVLAVLSWEL